MEKRVVLFFVASAALMFGWVTLQQRFFPKPPAAATPGPVEQAAPEGARPAAATAAAPSQAPGAASPSAPGAAADPHQARAPEQRTTLERPGVFRAVFSSWGAAPVELTLLDPQYQETVEEPPPGGGKAVKTTRQMNLIKAEAGSPPYLTWLQREGADGERSDVELARDAAWTLVRQGPTELVYAVDAGALHLEKTWRLVDEKAAAAGEATGGSRFLVELSLQVENRGAQPLRTRLLVSVDGWQPPKKDGGGFLSNLTFGARTLNREALCEVNGELKHESHEALKKGQITQSGDVRWIGTGEQFFLLAAAFRGEPGEVRSCHLTGTPDGRIEARVVLGERTLEPGRTTVFPMAAFAGPKLLQDLQNARVAGVDPHLELAKDYTLKQLARPMLWVLVQIHSVVRNWGLAIIVITVLLKLLTLWPTMKSMQSAKAMAKLKPEMDAIKARFPEDKAKQTEEQQKLWKKHGINPLGGCLPMLLQMPIYFAFYSMLSNAVELYRSSFFGPISDMTEPFVPLSIATGALMFVQQLTSPQAADPQQKQMMYMMPIMFMVFTLYLPSGLTLYILTNTLLTMLHQWWMNRRDPRPSKPTNPSLGPPLGPTKPARA